MSTRTLAIAELRHLYHNMTAGGVTSASSAKRIAEGLLSPTIQRLETETVALIAKHADELMAAYQAGLANAEVVAKIDDEGDLTTAYMAGVERRPSYQQVRDAIATAYSRLLNVQTEDNAGFMRLMRDAADEAIKKLYEENAK